MTNVIVKLLLPVFLGGHLVFSVGWYLVVSHISYLVTDTIVGAVYCVRSVGSIGSIGSVGSVKMVVLFFYFVSLVDIQWVDDVTLIITPCCSAVNKSLKYMHD